MKPTVGLDLSLTETGIAVDHADGTPVQVQIIESNTGVAKGVIPTWLQRDDRLEKIANSVEEIVPWFSLVVVEGPSYGSTGGSAFDRAGLWWRVFRKLREKHCQILIATPSQRAKYVTGKGTSSKDVVLASVVKKYPDLEIYNNNAADAVVFLAIGKRLSSDPMEDTEPTKPALEVLKALTPDFERITS